MDAPSWGDVIESVSSLWNPAANGDCWVLAPCYGVTDHVVTSGVVFHHKVPSRRGQRQTTSPLWLVKYDCLVDIVPEGRVMSMIHGFRGVAVPEAEAYLQRKGFNPLSLSDKAALSKAASWPESAKPGHAGHCNQRAHGGWRFQGNLCPMSVAARVLGKPVLSILVRRDPVSGALYIP